MKKYGKAFMQKLVIFLLLIIVVLFLILLAVIHSFREYRIKMYKKRKEAEALVSEVHLLCSKEELTSEEWKSVLVKTNQISKKLLYLER